MSQQMTPAERIRELSSINEDVAAMLKSAGLAVDTLTGRPPSRFDEDEEMTTEDSTDRTAEGAKATYKKHVTDYYTSLQAVIARLRRQAYALEEAGIVASEASTLSNAPARPAGAGQNAEQGRITNGGLGDLDIGWLNSRGNQGGMEKENEILIEAKEVLEELLKQDKEEPS